MREVSNKDFNFSNVTFYDLPSNIYFFVLVTILVQPMVVFSIGIKKKFKVGGTNFINV